MEFHPKMGAILGPFRAESGPFRTSPSGRDPFGEVLYQWRANDEGYITPDIQPPNQVVDGSKEGS